MADQPQDIPMFMDAPDGDQGFIPGGVPAAPMSDAQVMADAMVERGIWTREQAAAELAKGDDEGFIPGAEHVVKPVAPEGVDELTLAAFAPPKTITEYRFDAPPPGTEASQEQALAIKQVFMDAEIPAALGNMAAKLYDQAAASPPTPMAIQSAIVTTQAALEKQYGADTERCLEAARGEVARMAAKNPNIPRMMDESGMSSNLYVINSLISLARARGRLR